MTEPSHHRFSILVQLDRHISRLRVISIHTSIPLHTNKSGVRRQDLMRQRQLLDLFFRRVTRPTTHRSYSSYSHPLNVLRTIVCFRVMQFLNQCFGRQSTNGIAWFRSRWRHLESVQPMTSHHHIHTDILSEQILAIQQLIDEDTVIDVEGWNGRRGLLACLLQPMPFKTSIDDRWLQCSTELTGHVGVDFGVGWDECEVTMSRSRQTLDQRSRWRITETDGEYASRRCHRTTQVDHLHSTSMRSWPFTCSRASELTSLVLEISPSVRRKTCLDRTRTGGCCCTCFRGSSNSVPPKSASIDRIMLSACFAVVSLYTAAKVSDLKRTS